MRFRADDYDFFVFDCDGVILDSNGLKTGAFLEAALPYGDDAARRLVDFHQCHGGVSRQAKFRHFTEEILSVEPDEREAVERHLLETFAHLTATGLETCAEVPGVRAFLAGLPREARCYVVSGGAQDEVRQAISARGLEDRFELILGNPASKQDNMQLLAERGGLEGRGVYFGDARLDMEIALRYRLDFVFVWGVSEWADADQSAIQWCIRDFEDPIIESTERHGRTGDESGP